jgi:hypothetical protein
VVLFSLCTESSVGIITVFLIHLRRQRNESGKGEVTHLRNAVCVIMESDSGYAVETDASLQGEKRVQNFYWETRREETTVKI